MPTIAERWIQQGIEQGIQQGLLLDGDVVGVTRGAFFCIIPRSIAKKIKEIDSRELVKGLFKVAMRANSLEEYEDKLKLALK